MLDIWGSKCLFFDILVEDCFASIIGVHARSGKEKVGLAFSILNLEILMTRGITASFPILALRSIMKTATFHSAKGRFPMF